MCICIWSVNVYMCVHLYMISKYPIRRRFTRSTCYRRNVNKDATSRFGSNENIFPVCQSFETFHLVDSKCFQIKIVTNKFFFTVRKGDPNRNPWLAKMICIWSVNVYMYVHLYMVSKCLYVCTSIDLYWGFAL
jgi:Ni,Fe-hydrogenase I cytochrome b subunit